MANPSRPKLEPQVLAKQKLHKYYVDVSDILFIFDGALEIIKACPVNMTDYHNECENAQTMQRSIVDSLNNLAPMAASSRAFGRRA